MAPVTLYSSPQARPQVLLFVLDLQRQHCQLRLRTLGQLPRPRPGRLASLRLEQAALRQIERTLRWTLGQYAEGRRLPDPTREQDLRSDLDVTLWQLQQVAVSLHAFQTPPPSHA